MADPKTELEIFQKEIRQYISNPKFRTEQEIKNLWLQGGFDYEKADPETQKALDEIIEVMRDPVKRIQLELNYKRDIFYQPPATGNFDVLIDGTDEEKLVPYAFFSPTLNIESLKNATTYTQARDLEENFATVKDIENFIVDLASEMYLDGILPIDMPSEEFLTGEPGVPSVRFGLKWEDAIQDIMDSILTDPDGELFSDKVFNALADFDPGKSGIRSRTYERTKELSLHPFDLTRKDTLNSALSVALERNILHPDPVKAQLIANYITRTGPQPKDQELINRAMSFANTVGNETRNIRQAALHTGSSSIQSAMNEVFNEQNEEKPYIPNVALTPDEQNTIRLNKARINKEGLYDIDSKGNLPNFKKIAEERLFEEYGIKINSKNAFFASIASMSPSEKRELGLGRNNNSWNAVNLVANSMAQQFEEASNRLLFEEQLEDARYSQSLLNFSEEIISDFTKRVSREKQRLDSEDTAKTQAKDTAIREDVYAANKWVRNALHNAGLRAEDYTDDSILQMVDILRDDGAAELDNILTDHEHAQHLAWLKAKQDEDIEKAEKEKAKEKTPLQKQKERQDAAKEGVNVILNEFNIKPEDLTPDRMSYLRNLMEYSSDGAAAVRRVVKQSASGVRFVREKKREEFLNQPEKRIDKITSAIRRLGLADQMPLIDADKTPQEQREAFNQFIRENPSVQYLESAVQQAENDRNFDLDTFIQRQLQPEGMDEITELGDIPVSERLAPSGPAQRILEDFKSYEAQYDESQVPGGVRSLDQGALQELQRLGVDPFPTFATTAVRRFRPTPVIMPDDVELAQKIQELSGGDPEYQQYLMKRLPTLQKEARREIEDVVRSREEKAWKTYQKLVDTGQMTDKEARRYVAQVSKPTEYGRDIPEEQRLLPYLGKQASKMRELYELSPAYISRQQQISEREAQIAERDRLQDLAKQEREAEQSRLRLLRGRGTTVLT